MVGEGGTSGVSFNVNEMPVAANHFADTDFYDVERVEVLRGPQGTLYGRNATGGAVNVITNKPTDTFSGSITGEYGNYNERKITGYVNIPLGDMFAVRFAGFGLARDGFGTNLVHRRQGRRPQPGRRARHAELQAERPVQRLSDVRPLRRERQPQPGRQAALHHRQWSDQRRRRRHQRGRPRFLSQGCKAGLALFVVAPMATSTATEPWPASWPTSWA